MARNFNGSSDQIDCGAAVNQPPAISLACWIFYPSNPAGYVGIIGRNNAAHTVTAIILQRSDGRSAIYVTAAATINQDPGPPTNGTNAWCHLGFSYDSVGGLNSYQDGIFQSNTAANGTLLNSAGLHFAIGNDPNTAARFFGGIIFDVAQWHVPLTTVEWAALGRGVLRPYQIRPLSLDGYWPLDGYGHPALDRSGFNNNGVLTGTTLAPGPLLISAAPIPLVMSIPKIAQAVAPPPVFNLMPQIVT